MSGIKIEADPKFGTLSEGKFPIAARNFGTVVTVPNFATISTERRCLRFVGLTVDDIISFPLTYSWVNINTGVLTSTEPNIIFGLLPAQLATEDGIQIDNTPGDQHFIIEKRGIYSISISGKVSATAGGFAIFDADFGVSKTPPGAMVAAPLGDGLASGSLLGSLLPISLSGTAVVQVIDDLTRVDIWVKGSAMGVVAPQTLDIEQNLVIAITKVGEIPQN